MSNPPFNRLPVTRFGNRACCDLVIRSLILITRTLVIKAIIF